MVHSSPAGVEGPGSDSHVSGAPPVPGSDEGEVYSEAQSAAGLESTDTPRNGLERAEEECYEVGPLHGCGDGDPQGKARDSWRGWHGGIAPDVRGTVIKGPAT
ncbi:hypothetical protein NDU88_004340 [Pleurodeles waltl]|uniref:Uncharacterized protein n=1 Tax=Pleurodeles waltl TaxID=8319 RepID=A0AAV7KZ76_PLEWA|nr:hypothetical protein NDU88_004340 [Pleurodeles waltl]